MGTIRKKKSQNFGFTIRHSKIREVLRYIDELAEEGGFQKDYVVIGGMAVQIYLYSKYGKNARGLRETKDIDIAIKDNLFFEYLIKRGIPYNDKNGKGYTKVLNIDGIYIDVDIGKGVGISEEYFKEILNDSKSIEIKNGKKSKVNVISLEDLILIKADGYFSGARPKDLYDIVNLINAYEDEIDFEKIQSKHEKYFKQKQDGEEIYELLYKLVHDKNYRIKVENYANQILKLDNKVREHY